MHLRWIFCAHCASTNICAALKRHKNEKAARSRAARAAPVGGVHRLDGLSPFRRAAILVSS
jgi:hypothetical protein